MTLNRHPALLAAFALLAPILASCSPAGGFKITPIPADRTLEESIVQKAGWLTGNRVALVDIDGILLNRYESGLFVEGEHPVSFTVEKLARAAADDRVKAVVLRINSPGGTVTASDLLYRELRAFKKKTGKPIIACCQDVAASGGYYVACAADEIIVQRSTITGSIGVLMQMINLTGTMEKIGVTADAITSGRHKDTGSPLRRMRPEERALLQKLVDNFHSQFVDTIAEGRPKLSRDSITTLADGRVYSASEAVEKGLADRIGTLSDAIESAKAQAGVKTAHVVMYRRPLGWAPNVYANAPPAQATAGTVVNVLNIQVPFPIATQPSFWYLWGYYSGVGR